MKIILASASPRRRELMKLITENFDVCSVCANEIIPDNMPAENAAEYLASVKAQAASAHHNTDIVIGCDTTVVTDGRVLGKPADKNECRKFMELLSGRTHSVITGCALIYSHKSVSFSVSTEVTFRTLSNGEIEEYISAEEPYDKAGGYGIQGKGALLVEKINGDFFNVVGLPVSRLNLELKKFENEIHRFINTI